VTQARCSRAVFEALLAAHRDFLVEQQAEPFGMAERPGLGVSLKILQALGHA
jgi:hypothetical protein